MAESGRRTLMFNPILVRCVAKFFVAFSIWNIVPSALAGPALDRIRERKTINIAYVPTYFPFAYALDPKNTEPPPVGYVIDICVRAADAVKRKLGLKELKVNFMAIAPPDRIPSIAEGRADMECGATTNTFERRKKV